MNNRGSFILKLTFIALPVTLIAAVVAKLMGYG